MILQIFKWSMIVICLQKLKINILPCTFSLLLSHEHLLVKAIQTNNKFVTTLYIPTLIIATLHHQYYSNKLFLISDRILSKIFTCLMFWKFCENDFVKLHMLLCTNYYFCVIHIKTNNRNWNNIIKLIPHMLMHLHSGIGLSYVI